MPGPVGPGRQTDQRGEPEWIRNLRARLEAARDQDRIVEESRESTAAAMPEPLAGVVRGFETPRVFLRAEIAHSEPGIAGDIDLAWPGKRIGIRVSRRLRGEQRTAAITDDAWRELGWLILPVDPDAANSAEQLERALRVIKQMGVYRR